MEPIKSKKSHRKGGKKAKSSLPGDVLHNTFKESRKIPVEPLALNLVPDYTFRRRYILNATTSYLFVQQDGHNQFLVATTSILANSYALMWRIVSISIWAPITSIGASGNCSIFPQSIDASNNSFNDKAIVEMDSTTSADRPARLKVVTSPLTPLGSWHYTTSTALSGGLFQISATAGATVDIVFDVVINQSSTTSPYSTAIVGGTAGTLYARPFGTHFVPQNVNNI